MSELKSESKTDSVGGRPVRKALISFTVIDSSMMIANKQEADIWIDKMRIQPGSRLLW